MRTNLGEVRDRPRRPDQFDSQAQEPFDVLVRDAFSAVELGQSLFNLGEKHQAFDGIVDRRIRRQFPNSLDHLVAGDVTRHGTVDCTSSTRAAIESMLRNDRSRVAPDGAPRLARSPRP